MIEVTPVQDRRAREAFIRLPGRILADDPNWVEPLWFERRRFLTPKHNPFFKHGQAQLWLARREGSPVGRISAQIDDLAPPDEGRKLGYFGMLAAEDDVAVLAALFGVAEEWLRERGAGVVRGPFDFSINQTSGLLVDGFETAPSLLMNHDPRWLGGRVEEQAYEKAKDLVAYRMNVKGGLNKRLQKLAERGSEGCVLRSLDMRRYREEIGLIAEIFNDAWSENWGFTPLTEPEIDAMASEMKPIIDPGLVQIAEVHGEPVAFIVLLPNINEAIADLHGRLLPFGWLKLLTRIKGKRIRTGRVPLMGTKKAYANNLLGKSLPLKLIYALQPTGLIHDFHELELSWLLEDNMAVRRVVQMMGGAQVKTYRIYEKAL